VPLIETVELEPDRVALSRGTCPAPVKTTLWTCKGRDQEGDLLRPLPLPRRVLQVVLINPLAVPSQRAD
jgi:hypothetical protein